jgi:hypothetical protein
MNRCRYTGTLGDTLNVSLAITAWNLKKWARQVKQERKIQKTDTLLKLIA